MGEELSKVEFVELIELGEDKFADLEIAVL